MPGPEEEFERILAEANAGLGRIRLDLPGLDAEKSARPAASAAPPPPRVASLLDLPPPPAPPARSSFFPEPEPSPAAPAPPARQPVQASAPAGPQASSPAIAPPIVELEDEPDGEPELPSLPGSGVAAEPAEASEPSGAARRLLPRAGLAAAAAGALVALGLGAAAFLRRAAVVLPRPQASALAFDGEGRLAVPDSGELLFYARSGKVLERRPLPRVAVSLAYAEDSLWGCDGASPEAFRLKDDGSAPEAFQLDHAPTLLYARGSYLWSLDPKSRTLRQYLITSSMIGTFLQPLDRARLPALDPKGFSVSAAGGILVLERDGALRELELKGEEFAETSRWRARGPRAPESLFAGPAGEPWLSRRSSDGASLELSPAKPQLVKSP